MVERFIWYEQHQPSYHLALLYKKVHFYFEGDGLALPATSPLPLRLTSDMLECLLRTKHL